MIEMPTDSYSLHKADIHKLEQALEKSDALL